MIIVALLNKHLLMFQDREKVKEEGEAACRGSVGLTCLWSLQRAVLSAVRLTTSLQEIRVSSTCPPARLTHFCYGSTLMLELEVKAAPKGPQKRLSDCLTKADDAAPRFSSRPDAVSRESGLTCSLGLRQRCTRRRHVRSPSPPRGTCLRRDGTLQPQACMMPSSRRMCSRTCRYCSRRCSRRASTAESLRRDATPLLANL